MPHRATRRRPRPGGLPKSDASRSPPYVSAKGLRILGPRRETRRRRTGLGLLRCGLRERRFQARLGKRGLRRDRRRPPSFCASSSMVMSALHGSVASVQGSSTRRPSCAVRCAAHISSRAYPPAVVASHPFRPEGIARIVRNRPSCLECRTPSTSGDRQARSRPIARSGRGRGMTPSSLCSRSASDRKHSAAAA